MSNFKSMAKRKRELAKLDKRQAKEQKRAQRRAERSGADVGAPAPTVTAVAHSIPANLQAARGAVAERKPLTLTEAVERWRNMKVEKPKRR